MAQRFGGKYSPDGSETSSPSSAQPQQTFAPRAKAAARVNLLYLAPVPLLFTAFGKGATGMALNLGAVAVLWFGVFMLSEGLKAQAAYDARKVARRPALPRKIIAAVLAGFGVALAAFAPESSSLLDPLLFGGIAIVLHLLAFGIDPLANKNVEGIDTFQQDRVARVVDEAEEQLDRMTAAIGRAGDRGLERRVEAFAGTARRMCRTVEEDPRDLTAARKFLVVYLKGAADATVKFADLYGRVRDPQAKANYTALLDDLEQNFAAKSEKLMITDRTDLDVEIDVLRERLQREGVRMD